jgi:predicted nucleotidyltransferase component of viral defense system
MTIYDDQVKLLIRILPEVAKEECFALKGGTAINLFYRNLPRLSVDIDLSYINFDDREIATSNIEKAIHRICLNVNKLGIKTKIIGTDSKKIICSDNLVKIKIEPNYTIRGYAYEPQLMRICESGEEKFGFVKIKVVSKQELFGGKICAALDRQHPRDLFDIKELLDDNELTNEIIKRLYCDVIRN